MRERDKECSQSTLDVVVADEAPALPLSRMVENTRNAVQATWKAGQRLVPVIVY